MATPLSGLTDCTYRVWCFFCTSKQVAAFHLSCKDIYGNEREDAFPAKKYKNSTNTWEEGSITTEHMFCLCPIWTLSTRGSRACVKADGSCAVIFQREKTTALQIMLQNAHKEARKHNWPFNRFSDRIPARNAFGKRRHFVASYSRAKSFNQMRIYTNSSSSVSMWFSMSSGGVFGWKRKRGFPVPSIRNFSKFHLRNFFFRK